LENENSRNSSNKEFLNYVNLIPAFKLPFDFNCSSFKSAEIDQKNELIKKYLPEGAAIIGKFNISNSEIGIIYGFPSDIFYPIIYKYNLNGEVLTQVHIFENAYCGGDAGYTAYATGTITEDLI